jgi:hypothetical protein
MRLESSFDEHPRVLKMLPERVCDFSLFRSVHQYQQAAPEIQTPRFHPSASSSIPSPSVLVAFSFSFFSSWILPVHVSQCPRFSMLLFILPVPFCLTSKQRRRSARGKDEALCMWAFSMHLCVLHLFFGEKACSER